MIVGKGLPTSTGFTSTLDNIGEVESEGVEIDLDVKMLKLYLFLLMVFLGTLELILRKVSL